MTTIFDLPRKLVKEILFRVPLKSMRAVRLTCTNWNTLSKSRRFSMRRIGKTTREEEEPGMIMLMDYKLHLMNVTVNENPSIEVIGKLNEQVEISQVFHCEGLLLCILKDDDTWVVVWNPYSGQTRWIKPRYFQHRKMYNYALGYVNKKNKSCRSHKILRFSHDRLNLSSAPKNQCEIYDFDSDSWTTLDVPPPHWRNGGVSLKGNTYWCVTATNSEYEEELDNHIISFDFTKERFGPLFVLPFSGSGHHDYVTLLSCVREEKLAVLLQHDESSPNKIEIWITTNIEANTMSWSKFLKIDMGPSFDDNPISGSFFVDEEKKVAMGFYKNYRRWNRNLVNFIGEDGYFRELDLGERAERGCSASVCSYVPSSVQI